METPVDGVYFESAEDATLVLDALRERLDVHKVVSVSDFYDFCGIQGTYNDRRYGWTELPEVKVVPRYEGHGLQLPKPVRLP